MLPDVNQKVATLRVMRHLKTLLLQLFQSDGASCFGQIVPTGLKLPDIYFLTASNLSSITNYIERCD